VKHQMRNDGRYGKAVWSRAVTAAAVVVCVCASAIVSAQAPQNPPAAQAPPAVPPAAPAPATAPPPDLPAGVPTPPDYLIGPDDILTVVFWREKDMSNDVTVRPDGKISLPLLNDIDASGLTPDQLRGKLTEAAGKFFQDPTVTVVVKAIHSRKVFITGQVTKPGPYPLTAPTTVLQLIAMAGGVLEYADTKNIVVMRTENGKPNSYIFNYKDVVKRKNLKQNIELKPGDTIIVP
jgi:polysaccharide export outer membrane protein